jgi:hypothetical protein
MDEDYIYPKINEQRRERFLKYLAIEYKLYKKKKAEKYRKKFVERIESLRGIKSIEELRKEKKAEPVRRTEAEIEKRIERRIKESPSVSQIDLKEELNKSKIDELGERIKEMQDTISRLAEEKAEQRKREKELERKLFRIKKKQKAKKR